MLNHFIQLSDVCGPISKMIASQAHNDKRKELYLITIVSISGIDSYFSVVNYFDKKLNPIKFDFTSVDDAIKKYNSIIVV